MKDYMPQPQMPTGLMHGREGSGMLSSDTKGYLIHLDLTQGAEHKTYQYTE